MYCRNCGKEVDEKAFVCPGCGVPPKREKKFCHNCGVQTEPGQAVCVKCGVSLAVISSKSKIAAGVLAILIGSWGAHQFYLGNIGSAIIRLIVSLVGFAMFGIPTIIMAVISLVEGIIYLTMTDETFEHTYVVNKKAWF